MPDPQGRLHWPVFVWPEPEQKQRACQQWQPQELLQEQPQEQRVALTQDQMQSPQSGPPQQVQSG